MNAWRLFMEKEDWWDYDIMEGDAYRGQVNIRKDPTGWIWYYYDHTKDEVTADEPVPPELTDVEEIKAYAMMLSKMR